MMGVGGWWEQIRERRARRRRAVDVWWLSRLCEYHIEGRDGRDYKDEIIAQMQFICRDIGTYREQFPDIDRHLHLSRSVLGAPSVCQVPD